MLEKIFHQEPPTLRVTMLGPRGVGKTTVLTSIFAETVNSIAGTRLFLSGSQATAPILTNQKYALMRAFDTRNPANLPASSEVEDFEFALGISGIEKAHLIIKDYPGEYVTSPSKKNEVRAFIKEADIILVAIDTPYMMEEGGRYNQEKNEVNTIINFLSGEGDGIKDKLVLLTPLKCERYFHKGRIAEVSRKVTEVYGELLPILKERNMACLVTPIMTLGDCEYDTLVDNSSGVGLAKIATYKFVGEPPKYRPAYCNQPLYYLLTYVVKKCEYLKQHPSGTILERFMQRLVNIFLNDRDFYNEIKKLEPFLLQNEDGFITMTRNNIMYK